jgi:putative transposase
MPADLEPSPLPQVFQVLPRRWVVEHTFGWLGRRRGTSRDDDFRRATSVCVVELVVIRTMRRRLAESEA